MCVTTSVVIQNYRNCCTGVSGTYDCQQKVNVCETFLHQHCFLPAWKEVQREVSIVCNGGW